MIKRTNTSGSVKLIEITHIQGVQKISDQILRVHRKRNSKKKSFLAFSQERQESRGAMKY